MSVPATRLEELAATVRQRDGHIPLTMDANGLDQSLLAKMPEVSAAGIGGATIAITHLARRDDAKGAGGRQRATLRAAQGVLAATVIADDLPLLALRQIEIAYEGVPWIAAPFVPMALAFIRPIASSRPVVRIAVIRALTAAQLPRIVIAIAVAEVRPMSRLIPLVIAIAAITLTRIVVAIAWIVAPARIVKHEHLRLEIVAAALPCVPEVASGALEWGATVNRSVLFVGVSRCGPEASSSKRLHAARSRRGGVAIHRHGR